ncbi:16762_t:CDS:2 [Gigaspora margarita]|uniref:16762_t:CDS:1 n=1 Tax=Gigaspora margarita TaxID=4874 RepID=A0ABN7VQ80_GIGMA|nr:16762_t:CDS:2 [Gigaspora margarita]
MNSLFVFVVVAFNCVFAQTLSLTCQQEQAKLNSSSDLNNCASFVKLMPLHGATMQSSAQIYDSYCSAPKCSDNTTTNDANELKSQCQQELAAKEPFTTYLKTVLAFNSPLKDSLCFKNASGGYCGLDETTAATLNYILGLNSTQPANLNCNDCNKAILNTFMNYIKQHPESQADLPIDQSSFQTLVTSKCGNSFLDGSVPNTSNPPKKASGNSMHVLSSIGFMKTIIAASFIILIVYVI